MFWLFSKVLPIDEKQIKNCETVFGADLTKLIPDLSLTLASQCGKYLEDFNGYLEFIKQATAYMRNESNDQPDIDCNPDELRKHMTESLNEFDKNAKST
jgi:hypothetical protein